MLRKGLDANGFQNIKIVAADDVQYKMVVGLTRDVILDQELSKAVDYFGY